MVTSFAEENMKHSPLAVLLAVALAVPAATQTVNRVTPDTGAPFDFVLHKK